MVTVEVLKVGYGDCIFVTIEYEQNQNFTIMIDGGLTTTYRKRNRKGRIEDGSLKNKLDDLKRAGRSIDLLLITHVDNDHIGGITSWFSHDFPTADFVKQIWMNDDMEIPDASNLDNSTAQAASLIGLLGANGIKYENGLIAGKEFYFDWGRIVILAPNKMQHNVVAQKIGKELDNGAEEEYKKSIRSYLEETWKMDKVAPENDASIAILLQTKEGESDLFLGDACIKTVMDTISGQKSIEKPLKCKWVKLAHHGSKNNFVSSLLDTVQAEGFIFSTDGSLYHHPDKEVLAQIVDKTQSNLYFNYLERGMSMITDEDREDYPGIMERIKAI